MPDRFDIIAGLLREEFDERLGSPQRAVDTVQAAMPNSQVVSDGWGDQPADPWPGDAQPVNPTPPAFGGQQANQGQQYAPTATAGGQQHHQAATTNAPSCQHGPLKVVPGGYSQAKQKAYNAFWACPAPRGQQCRLNAQQLPPVPGA